MDYNSPTDVRIIVESAYDLEIVSKALKDLTIEENYGIVISSLISTTSSDLIKKAVTGADIVLVVTKDYIDNLEFNNAYVELLKNEVGHIECINSSDNEELEFVDSVVMGRQIENAIIRAGLSSIKILNHFQEMERQINSSLIKINELNKEIKNINSKNYELAEKLEEETQVNSNLQVEINSNNKHIDKLTERYNNLKNKNAYFEEKQLNEVFSIYNLWMEIFNESLKSDERIIFATNQFKPKDIIIGQGLISAPDKNVAIQWLKVVKTALFFIDSENNKLHNYIVSKNDNTITTEHNSELPEVKEETPNKEKKDINSKIMNLWD